MSTRHSVFSKINLITLIDLIDLKNTKVPNPKIGHWSLEFI